MRDAQEVIDAFDKAFTEPVIAPVTYRLALRPMLVRALAARSEPGAEGLDVDRLERAFVKVIDRRPTKVEVTYFYGDTIPVEHQRGAFLRDVIREYTALAEAEGGTGR